MRRLTRISGGVVCLTAILMLSGCGEDPKIKIAMLEDENHTLYADLEALRGNLDTLTQQRNRCQSDLLLAQRANGDLQGRLAAVPPPVDLPGQWKAVPGGAMIAIEGNMLFTSGNAALRKEARRALDAVVSVLQGNMADKDILVIGHTDDHPIKKSGWVDNYQLSTERSLAVVRYLRDRGVAPARLIAGGCGENRPRVAPASEADRAANRRVEIFALNPFPRVGQP